MPAEKDYRSPEPHHQKPIPSLDDPEQWHGQYTDSTDESSPAGLLKDEMTLLVTLVEDILQSGRPVRYRRMVGSEVAQAHTGDGEDVLHDGTFAVFAIEVNPKHDLEVLIELAPREFRFLVNDVPFIHRMSGADLKRPDKWMDKRCVDVEHLVKGDLKLEREEIIGQPLAWSLHAGKKRKWRQIGNHFRGWAWIGLLSWLLPFGLPLTQSEEQVFEDWPAREEDKPI